MGRKPNSERNNEILKMRLSGMTYKAIGAAFGITRGRIYQICIKLLKKVGGDNKS